MTRPIPNGRGWVKQAYSSYQNQQDMLQRIEMLEKCVAMLVRISVNNWTTPEAATALTMFADKVISPYRPEES